LYNKQNWQQARLLPCAVEVAALSYGEVLIMELTLLQFKASSRTCNRFRQPVAHLPRSLEMVQLLLGGVHMLVVTALQYKIS
jgi:hypothetical protein